MNGSTIIILLSVVVNVGVVAFSYGMLTQKVKDLCKRMGRVESILNSKATSKED